MNNKIQFGLNDVFLVTHLFNYFCDRLEIDLFGLYPLVTSNVLLLSAPRGGAWSGRLGGGAWSGGVPGLGGLLRGGGCLVETPSDSYCCGRYVSYWNAFLFFNSNNTI